MSSIQYTIRRIPEPVDKALRRRAKQTGKSFNQTVVDALKQAAGVSRHKKRYTDLDWFIGGRTIDEEEFDKAMAWLDALPNDMDTWDRP